MLTQSAYSYTNRLLFIVLFIANIPLSMFQNPFYICAFVACLCKLMLLFLRIIKNIEPHMCFLNHVRLLYILNIGLGDLVLFPYTLLLMNPKLCCVLPFATVLVLLISYTNGMLVCSFVRHECSCFFIQSTPIHIVPLRLLVLCLIPMCLFIVIYLALNFFCALMLFFV